MNVNEDELWARLESPAESLSDRMMILEARDKLLRLYRERQTNIETAKAVLGTCTDMCPEYERYFREENKQVSSLEMNDDNLADPFAMVKEYRRAAAEQEEPLPHEMRSPQTLKITMDYLCCNIIDQVEEDSTVVGEWYDFVWSRTRAIRKDITQEHLCDPTSVDLLEKCARFHIHCAQALSDEDASIFDPKINTENLNKCIQSLKDLYNDLNLKGQRCPNEPEFRAYYLLMNLGNSSVIREIKFFEKSLRDSEPIRFVLKCYYAISGRKFFEFFKLVRSTTYLNACVLHGYFYQVRSQAFKVLRNACSILDKYECYPAADLTRQLGFTNEEELQIFCENIGVEYDPSGDGSVILRRNNLSEPENSHPVRSRALVEMKRSNKRLSEIIYGGPLPENPYHKYHLQDSFDDFGKLKKEALEGIPVKRLRYSSMPPSEERNFPIMPSNPVPDEPLVTPQQRRVLILQLIDIILIDVLRDISKGLLNDVIIENLSMNQGKVLYEETTWEIIYRLADHSYRQELMQQSRRDHELKINTIAEIFTKGIVGEIIYHLVRRLSIDMLITRRRSMIDSMTSFSIDLLINEVTQEETHRIAKECYEEELEEKQLMDQMKKKHLQTICKKYFRHWHLKTIKAKRFRLIKSTFPAGNMKKEFFKIDSIDTTKRKPFSNGDGRIRNFDDDDIMEIKKRKFGEIDDLTVIDDQEESFQDALKPNTFAEQVARLSSPESWQSKAAEESPLDELKRKIELERYLAESFDRNLQAIRLSFDYNENNDPDEG
ncbi:RRM_XMAS2 and SAC3_GANP domain-containing protein xmas [Brevipalpus obovatus]|uniref:RRM_XMAS2 and SAC3_GANP domain-containing protein xmas n=1 Tax=Brevipalpus obovatus TaxID=246614 RepID=UPI003D9F29C4